MGGQLEIVAKFPEGNVRIGQFRNLQSDREENDQKKAFAAG
jgi:hypothetical protein